MNPEHVAGRLIGGGLPVPAPELQAEEWMRAAIAVARSTPEGDVPVGAVVISPDGRIIGQATNRREADSDPTAHAEVLALRQAASVYGDGWRLTGCTLVVTLEPCAMCAGALVGARVREVIFGAYEPRTGACGSVIDVVRDPHWTVTTPAVRGGVLAAECAELLDGFFGGLRG